MDIKVSIIVPVYKVEAYLERCVESLRNQTLKEIEIILVDDGSPDACPAMCDRFAEEDARIRVIHKENQGAGMARNAGLELAQGEYLGFADSDDYVEPEMFETLWRAAKSHDADMVLSGELNYENGDGGEKKHCFDSVELFVGREDINKLILGTVGARPEESEDSRYGTSIWSNIYRTSIIRENKLRFLSERDIMSEDMLFFLDFIPHIESAVGIPGAFYHYCRNQESVSKSFEDGRIKKVKIFGEEMERRLKKRLPESEYRIYLDRQYQAQIRFFTVQEISYARSCGMGEAELNRRLADICDDAQFGAVLRRYPWRRLPVKQAIFAFAMRFRMIWLIKLLVALRTKAA